MPLNEVQAPSPAIAKPWWRRVAEFPLVAMLLALAALFVPLAALTIAASVLPLGDLSKDAVAAINGTVIPLVVVVVYKLVVSRIGEQPRDDLPLALAPRQGLAGVGAGLAIMTLIVAVVALLGGYRISGWGGNTSLVDIVFMAGFFAAFLEEIVMRGIVFRFLEEFAGSWAAIAISAGLFGFAHLNNPNATVFSSVAIAVEAGILLAGAYMLTRNLWFAIGIHFGWNVTQGWLFDVPVSGLDNDGLVAAHPAGSVWLSGGAFGLEASVVALVLATAFGCVLVWKAAQRGHVVRPWWVRRREGGVLPA